MTARPVRAPVPGAPARAAAPDRQILTGDVDVPTPLGQIEAELLAREPIFHRPELGCTREDYLAQTAGDFWEVGASGQVYDREHVISVLLARGRVPGDEDWWVSEVRLRPLAADTYALTYLLDQDGRRTRRLTLWRVDPDGWKVLYHQGTVIQQP